MEWMTNEQIQEMEEEQERREVSEQSKRARAAALQRAMQAVSLILQIAREKRMQDRSTCADEAMSSFRLEPFPS